MEAPNRYEKSLVVHGVVEQIQASGGRFLKHDEKTGSWYELSSAQMKEKVGHAIRDAVNALEARAERKRFSETKEERDPVTTSPAPVSSIRDKGSPLGAQGFQLTMPDLNPIHTKQHFHHPPNRSQKTVFEPSQSLLYHQQSPSEHQRPYNFPPVPFPQRYHVVNRQEEYQHSSCLHDGGYYDQHHPALIEPIPYNPIASESKKTSDARPVVHSDAGRATGQSNGELDDHRAAQPEKDFFLEQINQVLGPIVDDGDDSCVSV
ncbi:hypothetical protein FisN_13Lh108 [Fistulifera solaris]|uniref:DUF6824 domain-containing protein n=1 Tax=Fistulifera solaris TaxID=1519565 RepID=A0A1Z5JF51_FISSO|nr:hypothetical protein FisN_13Lh108 [Fistulifera solaris]|eukprot:GAX12640.1 hypothetical protein FisN_13Lh108 [Fistulifera solaris]